MTITISLTAVHDGLPAGLSPADNEAGWRSAFEKRAALTPVFVSPSSFVAGSPGPVTLSTTLTTQDTDTPISGATIAFSVDGASLGTASTNSAGVAAFSYHRSLIQAGTHTVEAVFAREVVGDSAFDASISGPGTFHVEPSPYTASVQPPIKADGSSVFNLNRGVVPVKFTLTYNGSARCDVPAVIALSRTTGTVVGAISESVYALPADSGSSFRIDTGACQYVYNLATGSLGTGTYAAYMLIGGNVVGRATFGLQ